MENKMLFSFFLVALFSTNFLTGSSEPGIDGEGTHPVPNYEAVLDTEGHPVLPGVKYYILPPSPGAGAGLTLAPNKGKCPYEIVQILNKPNKGLPVTFSSSNAHDKVIPLNTDLNIKFIDIQQTTPCHGISKVWKINPSKQKQAALFVTVGGVEGKPGPETLPNWFKIQKENKYYKIQHCPSVCKKCKVVCGDVGPVIYNGNKHLAVKTSPLSVVFKKA